jgi:hypothetical protein
MRSFWSACTDPTRCRGVAPGGDTLLPYEAVSGYGPGAETALVYWWHLEPKLGGGFIPDTIRVETVHF